MWVEEAPLNVGKWKAFKSFQWNAGLIDTNLGSEEAIGLKQKQKSITQSQQLPSEQLID